MAKQLNVNLNFTADTSQAQRNLMELSKTLNSIANTTPINNLGLSKEMQEAKASAKELQQHISNAFNTKTGNLDLNKLNASLQSSGQSLGALSANLLKAGTTGEQAFMNIQKAISTASVQINQTNGLLTEFWTTLKNTARWQISSSILHGFMGALQSAWGYAKDLDKSLNDIRIVTGYNTEKMAEFAEQANKAAKALSTTTTSYTNASLIYYQQGLNEKEVLERTNITVKMANVAGKSAAEVSDQLTAVWNNFYDGSKSLEYYADVMTALGAATASSTDEIAQGLEKFAAVAETVGLSYEYATAALTTVTAETRQSADVVGTAFKTLFARLQDLELGETLDDGTTLGKYSAALDAVGINIKNTNGELKDMDQILDELGNKWTNLSKDTQVALAQTVAGTRQYTQLVALMDNWDVFQTNLGTVDASEGALTTQAEIYAESWEAATARVQATAQGIYKDLFPIEDLIELANGFAVFLEGVDGVVEGLGGIKGILLLISTIALNAFQNQIGGAIQSVISKVSSLSAVTLNLRKSWTGVVSSTAQLNSNLQQVAAAGGSVEKQSKLYENNLEKSATSATRLTQEMITTANSGKIMSDSISTYTSGMSQINNLQILIENSSRHLTSEQKEQLSLLQQQAIAANEQAAAAQASLETAKKRQEISLNTASAGLEDADKYEFVSGDDNREQFSFISDEVSTKTRMDNAQALLDLYDAQGLSLNKHNNHLAISVEKESELYKLNIDSKQAYSDIYTANLKVKSVQEQLVKSGKQGAEADARKRDAYTQILKSLTEQDTFTSRIIKNALKEYGIINDISEEINYTKMDLKIVEQALSRATSQSSTMAKVSGTTTAEIKAIQTHVSEVVIAEQQAAMQAENFKNKIDGVSAGLQNALQSAMDTGHIISGMASGLNTVAMGISSISNMWSTLNDEEATFVEQLSAGAMGATMGISALMTTMKGLQSVYQSIQAAQKLKAAMDMVELHNAGKLNEAEMVQSIVNMMQLKGEEREAAVKSLTIALQERETEATVKDTVANWANVASQAAKLWYVTLIVAAVAALVAITIALVTAESKAEKQAKRSAKAAEEMKEASEDAANALNDIKSAFDAYDTAVQKLEECREGTEEWNNALREVNKTVLKILQDVPELAANANLFVRDPSSGMLTINESEKANVLAAAEQKANTTAALSLVSTTIATVDRIVANGEELAEEIGNSKGVGLSYGVPEGDEETYDDTIAMGSILTQNAEKLMNLNESEYRIKVEELLREAANDTAKSYSGFDAQIESLVNSAVEYQSQINMLGTETEAVANQMHTAMQLLVDQNLDSYGGAEKSIASVELEKNINKLKEDYYNLMTSNANNKDDEATAKRLGYKSAMGINQASGADNAIYKFIAEKLADATNNEYTATTGNTVLGDDNNRRFIFDKGGDRVEKSATWVAQQIAAAEALKKLNKSANDASTALENMDARIASVSKGFASNETAETAMRGFIASQNFEGLSIGDLTAFQKEVAQFNPEGISTGNASKADIGWYLDQLLGDGKDGTIDDTTAEKYDFKNTQDMIDTFYNQLTAKYKLIESLTIDEAGLIDFNKLSEKAAIAFDNAYKQMNLGPLGEKAGETFVNGINDILNIKKLDPDKQVEALEKLSEIDWSAYDSLEKVQAIMAGFNVDLDIVQWKEFAETMRIAYNATPDYAKIKTELNSIGAIIADIEFGSIVKEEDFEVLAKYSAAWRDLFILQADGTRKFIGNAEDMKKAMQTSIRENGEDLLKKEQYATAIKNAGIKTSYSEEEIEIDGKDGLFRFYDNDKATITLKNLGYNVSNGVVKKGNEEISQADASKIVMANQRGQFAKDLINEQEIQDALQMQGYSRDRQNEIISAALAGNDEELKVMLEGLNTLVGQDYEQLNKDFQQMLASTATSFGELNQMLVDNEIEMDAYEQGVKKLLQEQINAATTMGELEQAWSAALATGTELDYNIYIDGLLQLSEQYSICAEEAKAFSIALQSNNEEARRATEENLEATILLGEAADTYGFKAEELSIQSKQLAKEYGLNAKTAAKLTIENQRMNKGVETLVNNWDNWSSELKSNNKLSRDWSKAAAECTKAIADLVGASEDLELPADFFDSAKNMDLLSQAAEGSTKAINELGLIVANVQIQMLSFQEGMQNAEHEFIDQTQFDTWKTTIMSGITDLQNALNNVGMGTDVYEKLGGDKWIAALNEMAIATQMSVDQMNSILNSMGVQAEVEVKSVKQKMQVPTYTEYVEQDETGIDTNGDGEEDAFGYRRFTVPGEPQEVEGYVQVAQIKTADSEIGPPKIKYTGNGNVSNSAKSGGTSGSKAKKVDKTKKSDVVDRYKEITDSIDDVQNAMNDASRAADRLYGTSRLKQMQKQNDLIKDEIDLLKQKKEQALDYLEEDRRAVADAAKEAGVELNIDENGFISNYTQAMTELYKELDAAINSANADGNADETETERIDAAQKRIDELKSAMDQYDETRDMIRDLDNQLDEKFYEWQDNNYEQLTYKLELNLELNDMELEDIEYELNKIVDDFYKMAEAAALMVDSSASAEGISQLDIYSAKLEAYEEQRMALDKAFFENEEISQAAYVEGMKEIKSGIYENLEAIQELDKSMMDYYGNTLDMAADEIAKYTDRMDHQVSVLDHYSSLLEIMGKQNDYKTMHKTLEAKAQIIGDQVAVAKDTLEMYQGQAEARFNEYQDALARGDEKAAELYLKQYEAALAAANEAQDVYLSKAEEWAEALKAVLENKLADIGKTLEEALTGGTSFDEISKQMERANSLQEEYLTTTNKIYKTNKMINTAQQAIDKTDNLNAKRRLRSFQEETAQMQNKGKLSKFELEIQQAKYDLLLAEIALEEAQNAKSMVRLQRDSEGNFGYVYTADDQKVAEAEQNAMDKENALYNIRLEGANSYVEKYQQTMQEMYDELQDLTDRYHNGEIESFEEYQRLMTETQNHYYQKLEDYSELYGIAIQEDTRIIEDAWSTEFASMTENTEEWKKNVDIYIGEVSTAFDNYEKEMERIALETGTDMASMENSIKEVVDESKNLKDALVGENGLISAINDQATAVANITSHYASLRDSLGLITAAYEASGKAASDAIIKQQEALQAIKTTNTALDNQAGIVGTDGSLVKDEGTDEDDDGKGDPPKDPEESTVNPPEAPTIRVEPFLTDTGRGGTYIKVSDISIVRNGRPLSAYNGTSMWEIGYHGNSKTGYITNDSYKLYQNYFKDLEEYNKTIASMDTGGYTGSWGTEGKLAMLHQKELVLNANDTQNFLTSLDVLHEIIKMIDLQAINSRVGGFLQIPNMNFAPNEILDQQVHIEASFPGVTDRNEIEEAFKTLVNRASQFANRKNF